MGDKMEGDPNYVSDLRLFKKNDVIGVHLFFINFISVKR